MSKLLKLTHYIDGATILIQVDAIQCVWAVDGKTWIRLDNQMMFPTKQTVEEIYALTEQEKTTHDDSLTCNFQ